MTPEQKKKWKLTLVVILLIVAGVSIGVVIQSGIDERASQQKQEQLRELYNSSESQSASPTPSTAGPVYANPQFEELLKLNPELVGWLEVGELSTPVVQTDNNDYYLKHDFYGKEDAHGTVFADARNTLDALEDNLILYGHNYQKSKQIFYEVERYRDPEYAKAHPVISFTTLHEKRDYLVFGLFISNTEPSQGDVFDYHNQLRFDTVKAMEEFIAETARRSLISTNIPVNADDQLITLSTCGYDFAGERIVLVARRLREDETPEKLAQVTYSVSAAPLMPEIWENLYGKKQS